MKALLPEGEAEHVRRGQDMVPATAEEVLENPAAPLESSAPESKPVLLLQNAELSICFCPCTGNCDYIPWLF